MEKLIELVQKYPALYNSSLKNYKNQCIQAQSWSSIAGYYADCGNVFLLTYPGSFLSVQFITIYLIVPNDVSCKWKTLKDKFLGIRKLYCTGAPSAVVLNRGSVEPQGFGETVPGVRQES